MYRVVTQEKEEVTGEEMGDSEIEELVQE